MVRVIHKKCGKVAFHFIKKVKVNELVYASNVVLFDGSHAKAGSIPYCESCGNVIKNWHETEQEHWTDWFIKEGSNEKS